MVEYRNISLKKELADAIEVWINAHPSFAFRSIASFVEDATRARAEKLGIIGSKTVPRFEHFNVNERGVLIRDREINPDYLNPIYFRPEGIRCDYCQIDNCIHIQYALTVPKVQAIIRKLRKDGWKLPDV